MSRITLDDGRTYDEPTFDEYVPQPQPQPQPEPQPFAPTYHGGTSPPFEPNVNSGNDVEAQLKNRLGSLYDSSILGDVQRNTSNNGGSGSSEQQWIDRIVSKNLLRGSNEPNSQYHDNGQGGYTVGPTGTVNGAGAQARPGSVGTQSVPSAGPSYGQSYGNVGAQFTDPITSFLEKFAQQQAQRLENPPPDSGQALLEQALKSMSGQFQAGGYTPHEQEVLNTQGIEPIEQLRQSRKKQVVEMLAARGIDPKSGVGIQMIADVDRQFDGMRTTTQASQAATSAQETQQRMLQAIQLLTGLAGTQNTRLDEAFKYRSVPMNLADRSFNQAQQVYNMGGNPNSLISSLLQLSGQNQSASQFQQSQAQQDAQFAQTSQQRQDELKYGRTRDSQNNQSEALGYLAYILSQQGGG